MNFEGLHQSVGCRLAQRAWACLYSKVFTILGFLITVLETLDRYLLVDRSWYVSLMQPV